MENSRAFHTADRVGSKKDNIDRCIFHIPYCLNTDAISGSQVRPRKMMQAFYNIGYQVDIVAGYGAERKETIKYIKKNIEQGVKYDFMYSESSTMPTLLTEKHHFPVYPNLDFSFFSFCKKHNIPIGLFYRDIHWRFPHYKENIKGLKYLLAQVAYRYDLKMYTKLIDIFYVPSEGVRKYIGYDSLTSRTKTLPPGSDYKIDTINSKNKLFINKINNDDRTISLFYVGGIGTNYRLHQLCEAIQDLDYVSIVLCCREAEWQQHIKEYEKYLTSRVSIVHVSGEKLEKYYNEAMIGLAFFERNEYVDMAMPVKVFEYLAHAIPIIAVKNTMTGKFVSENEIGWSIEHDTDALRELLIRVHDDFASLFEKHKNTLQTLKQNTWEKRAEKVRDQLVSCKNTLI
ncbi:MAG TPA: glycosyltransferase [Candidatus Eisenbacteria bacterium]|nr:glycosyltransferase [Candidatus Eisenbacteria bacterium]